MYEEIAIYDVKCSEDKRAEFNNNKGDCANFVRRYCKNVMYSK